MRKSCGHADRYTDGHCRPCTLERRAQRRRERANYVHGVWKLTVRGRAGILLDRARRRAKEKGWPKPTINVAWVRERLERGACELSGLPFKLERGGRTGNPFGPSIDRIDCTKPYTEENCRVIVWALNAAFAEWGEDEFRLIARAWLAKRPGCDLI
jgi:hypothetical protein